MNNSTPYDLIVVGSGMAGQCTALAMAQLGGRVLVLEKTTAFGGSTLMCAGAFAFAGTDIQKKNKIEDSSEILEADLLKAGEYINDRSLVKVYVDNQYSAYRWLEGLGLIFDRVGLSGNQSVPRNHGSDPRRALALIHQHALDTGQVTFQTQTQATQLITEGDDENKRVIGVKLSDQKSIYSNAGVMLASGGFSRATDIVQKFAPHLLKAKPMGGHGNTGDGLRMAWALGADVADLGFTKGTFGAVVDAALPGHEKTVPLLIAAMYYGAIVTNQQGKRFIDESQSYKEIGEACLKQDDAIGFQIFDQRVMDQSTDMPNNRDFQAALNAGVLHKANSLSELAQALKIPASQLLSTIDAYNKACQGQIKDECGRTCLSSGYGKPTPVDRGPFYGVKCTTGLTTTFSGLRTDTHARVLNVFNKPIWGLYAAGEITGGFHGKHYMSGTSLGKGCIFGRLAAQDAMKHIQNKVSG